MKPFLNWTVFQKMFISRKCCIKYFSLLKSWRYPVGLMVFFPPEIVEGPLETTFLKSKKKKLCLTSPKICPPDTSSGSDHDLDHQIILKKWHFVINLVISWSNSKASKLSTCLRAHRAVRTNDNTTENPKNTPSLVLLKNKKKEQETKLKKHKTDFKNGLSPVPVHQSVNNRLEEEHHLCIQRLQPSHDHSRP